MRKRFLLAAAAGATIKGRVAARAGRTRTVLRFLGLSSSGMILPHDNIGPQRLRPERAPVL
ncbi:hypothetical protein [Mesorhizobium sp.]|uniref:hypothetical protein n=1 Tax=Mesorhizobium sp. TaxID=1871066 RepID=UPI00257F80BE|nr:hypothetical protein [Mesorhizobium sp.]